MEPMIADSSNEGFFVEPELIKSPSKHSFFHKIRNHLRGKDDTALIERQQHNAPESPMKIGPRGIGIGPPRQQTFRRQNSERRDKLEPNEPTEEERRALSTTRLRTHSVQGRSKQRQRTRSSPPPPPPRLSLPNFIRSHGNEAPASWKPQESRQTSDVSKPSEPVVKEEPFEERDDHIVGSDEDAQTVSYDDMIQQELDSKWILNLSMHFRDKSDREKFFLTYAETPTKWRRVTVSCDYRHAEQGSLEIDLKELQYQRDKNFQIYESIRESLPEIQFYDTVTNLKLETTEGRLHVHVTEDVNEIIHYPPYENIRHLVEEWDPSSGIPRLETYCEDEVEFKNHLSGFVYRVSVHGRSYIKKEIPGPDSVDEFLYEINALHSLMGASNVIQLQAIILDDSETFVKGLLINFAEKGALVDILFDNKGVEEVPWISRLKWAEQIVSGLNEIHEAGFVQGDFTLSNVVIDSNDEASIIDINRRGCPVGWEPPELETKIKNNQRISMYIGVKSDLFQLGMSLWALAMHDDEPERRPRPLSTDDFNSEVPKWYRDITRTCLSPRPQDRLSAKELLDLFRVARRENVDGDDLCEEEDTGKRNHMAPHRLPTPTKSIGRVGAESFDNSAMDRPPSSSYQFPSTSSYVDVSRGPSRGQNHRHEADEMSRGRRRSRDDELEVDENSDSEEPRILSISPSHEPEFDELVLDGNPYLVHRSTFGDKELQILEQSLDGVDPNPDDLDLGKSSSLTDDVFNVDPRSSVETVAAAKRTSIPPTSNKPNPLLSTVHEASQIPLPSSQASTTTAAAPITTAPPRAITPPLSPINTSESDLFGCGSHPNLRRHSDDEPSDAPLQLDKDNEQATNELTTDIDQHNDATAQRNDHDQQ